MQPLLMFRPFVLEQRSTISLPGADPPTVRFRFGMLGLADQFDLGLGDHVKIRWRNGTRTGKPRSYSPLAGGLGGSDPSNRTFDLVVKIYDRSGASSWLGDVNVGDAVQMSGPFPPLREMLVRTGGGDSVGIVCFGVGITEGIAVAAAELSREPLQKVTLLWAHRYARDEVLTSEVDALQRQHPTRFVVRRAISREDVDGAYRGRVSAEMLSDAFGLSHLSEKGARFQVIGTKPSIKSIWEVLSSLGWPRAQHELLQKSKALGFVRGLLRLLMGM